MDGDGPVEPGPLVLRAGGGLLAGCGFLLVIGVQPPNDKALWIVLGFLVLTATIWLGFMRHHFEGPPRACCLRSARTQPTRQRARTPGFRRSSGPSI